MAIWNHGALFVCLFVFPNCFSTSYHDLKLIPADLQEQTTILQRKGKAFTWSKLMLPLERFQFIDELVFLFKASPALTLRGASIWSLSEATTCWCVCRSFSQGMHFITEKWFYWINNRWAQAAPVEVKFLHGCGLQGLGMSGARLLCSLAIGYILCLTLFLL